MLWSAVYLAWHLVQKKALSFCKMVFSYIISKHSLRLIVFAACTPLMGVLVAVLLSIGLVYGPVYGFTESFPLLRSVCAPLSALISY